MSGRHLREGAAQADGKPCGGCQDCGLVLFREPFFVFVFFGDCKKMKRAIINYYDLVLTEEEFHLKNALLWFVFWANKI
jgi:hypothetical protein